MDISKIEDVKELKALAYDQAIAVKQAENNLRVIEARIAEVQKSQDVD